MMNAHIFHIGTAETEKMSWIFLVRDHFASHITMYVLSYGDKHN